METKDYVKLIARLNEGNPSPGGLGNLRAVLSTIPKQGINDILEIGVNTGISTIALGELFPEKRIVGIDIEPEMVDASKSNISSATSDGLILSKSIEIRVGDVEKLEFPNNSIDLIVSGGTLSFINDRKKAMQEIYRVLKPNGFFISLEYGYETLPSAEISSPVSEILGFDVTETTVQYWTNLHLSENFSLDCIQVVKPLLYRSLNIDLLVERIRRNRGGSSENDLKLYKEAFEVFKKNEPYANIVNLTLRKLVGVLGEVGSGAN